VDREEIMTDEIAAVVALFACLWPLLFLALFRRINRARRAHERLVKHIESVVGPIDLQAQIEAAVERVLRTRQRGAEGAEQG
jgi:hypothetical protein